MEKSDPSRAYRLLEAGPVLLVATAQGGRANLKTMGFHMVVQHAPPLIGCVVGPWDHSHKALRETGEYPPSLQDKTAPFRPARQDPYHMKGA